MRIDINIANAIDRYLSEENMTAAEFARKMGISSSALVKWRRPGNGITGRRWRELFPLIRKHLPQERIYIAQNGEEQYSSLNETARSGNPYYEPKFVPQMVPVFTEADLKAYMPLVQSVEQYARQNNLGRTEYRPRVAGCGGMFCHVLTRPVAGMPSGARLYVNGEAKPAQGCMALAVDVSGNVHIGPYSADREMFNVGGITGKLSEAGAIASMICPVIMYEPTSQGKKSAGLNNHKQAGGVGVPGHKESPARQRIN